jgi:hypothetical protein
MQNAYLVSTTNEISVIKGENIPKVEKALKFIFNNIQTHFVSVNTLNY